MKRILSLAAVLIMILCLPAQAILTSPVEISIRLFVGESMDYQIRGPESWQSDHPEVVTCSGTVFTAVAPGTACLTATDSKNRVHTVNVTVVEGETDGLPAQVRAALDIALNEWEAAGGEAFRRSNKYTLWYSNGNKYEYGWCAAFECYCVYHAGIPMAEWTKSTPHDASEVWGVEANGVGKVIQGYDKMNRLTFIPKPGYLVVYGQADSGTCMHIGMITDVEDLGEGRYIIKTVEGNMGNRIKRYCYLYEIGNADENKANGKKNYSYTVKKNYSDAPEEYRTEEDTFQYTKHKKNWYVYRFCATW